MSTKNTIKSLQNLFETIVTSPKTQKVLADVQEASSEIKSKIEKLSNDKSVKKYKDLLIKKEKEMKKDLDGVVSKLKKSAIEAEKNLLVYKKKAEAEKAKIEKMIKAKIKEAEQKANGSKSTAKKTTKKTAVKKTTAKKKAAVKK